jgi:hypothetical protein
MDTSSEVWDSFDIDLVVKVLVQTAFSESLDASFRMLRANTNCRPILRVLHPRVLLVPGVAGQQWASRHSRDLLCNNHSLL